MKQLLISIMSILCVHATSFSIPDQGSYFEWKAGVAKIDITPSEFIWMAGYGARTKPAEGKLHDLWAKALFLVDSAGQQALLITTDLTEIPKDISDLIRDGIHKQMGLSRSQIILNSSHTHSGPVLFSKSFEGMYPMDTDQLHKVKEYREWLINQIIELAVNAKKSLEPVTIYSGNGVTRFQVNRRNNIESELTSQTELEGPNDFAVPVLKVTNKKGKIKVIIFGYACHSTVLNGYYYSGDYPGFAQIELEKKYKGATAMFFQGAGADQNPLPRRTVALAQQYGKELAAAVERVIDENMRKLSPQLATAYSEVYLPFDTLPSRDELIKMKKEFTGWQKQWAKNMLDKINKGELLESSYPYPAQVWSLGNQLIISLGGELFVDYSIKLKQIFDNDIFVMGYSNDVMAYILSEKERKKGGYEETAYRFWNLPAPWKLGTEKIILNEVVKLAYQVGVRQTPELTGRISRIINNISLDAGSMQKKQLIATSYFSGFDLAHDTYNTITTASDGRVYYCLSSQSIDTGGQYYVYDPRNDEIEHLGDITEICGEAGTKAIPQGKSHSNFYESKGKLYISTHAGYYEMIDGMEMMVQNPPEGYSLYPGGHILSYDLTTGEFEDLAILPRGEAIVTMTMDTLRRQIYAISWPYGYLFHYDVEKDELKDLGKISGNGEAGTPGQDYRVLCRSLVVDPRDGTVYFSTSEGDILSYNPDWDSIKKVEGVNLRLDYFGKYDPTRPGSMQYNWRRIIWYPGENVAYGVHGNSGYLFRFDPKEPKIEIVERITSEPSKKSGMFDYFSYGYLGFDLGPDGETLYYLTGGPIYIDGKRVEGVEEIAMGAARGLENLHLVTYHIPIGKYIDHGPIFYEDGSRPIYVNSIAIGNDGTVYTLARFEHDGKEIEDLVKISNPFNY